MLERRALLAGKHKAALRPVRQRSFPACAFELMLFTLRQQCRCMSKALFGVDHLPRGEPLFAASVLAQRDQVGRTANRPHGQIELLLAVAVPMHEHSKVAVGEGGLAVHDRVKRDSGIGDNPLAVA